MNVLGPQVLTFTHVQVDPKISQYIPELLDIYQRWLSPIQTHHTVFSVMEGMAEFCVMRILSDDQDFQAYLHTFADTNISAYRIKKSTGRDFASAVYQKMGKAAFRTIEDTPPTTTHELKDPQIYLNKLTTNV